MTPLTPEQEIIKLAVIQEITPLLEGRNSQSLCLFKPAQVQRMLNISRKTLALLRTSGALPAKRITTCYRYAYPDILNLLDKSSVPLTAKTKTK